MLDKIYKWLNQFSNATQLLLIFLGYWVSWILVEIFFPVIWPETEVHTWKEMLVITTFIAVMLALVNHWKRIKLLFKKNAGA